MSLKHVKPLALALLAALALAGCRQTQGTQEQLSIPAVTVDLAAPENCVQVPQSEDSRVTDENGQVLTDSQWLLNSKFSKSYIKSLGVGTYSFTYESQTHKGTIELTVTDDAAPAYQFNSQLDETVAYRSSVVLPELVKDQDSYQDDCAVSYTLLHGQEAVELADGFVTPALAEGSYTWLATVTKGGTAHEFAQSFKVQSFDEYLQEQAGALLWDQQKNSYIAPEDGKYAISTVGNTLDYFYTLNADVLSTAITAGKQTVTLTVVTDTPLSGGESGSVWVSNGWNGYVFGVEGTKPFTVDRTSKDWPTRYYSAMERMGEKYVYTAVAYLDSTVFTTAQPLTLQFNYAQCEATVTVSFE